jgi:rod shape-determining protein MreC
MAGGFVLLAFSGVGLLRPVEDFSYAVLSPVENGLRAIARPAAEVVARYGDARELTQENEALRAENERLNAEVARLHEGSTRLEEYERLLRTRDALAGHEPLIAEVVSSDPTNGRRRVAINKGRSDGLEAGMPVVTEGSTLVGTVTKVESGHAWVTLVTDVDSAVSSHILESRAQGVVAGRYDGSMRMEFVDQNAAVKEGDRVITSGLGGAYPDGLVIGRITEVDGNAQELFQSVTVEPLASLSNLENVLVLVSFVPAQVSTP